MSLTVMYPSKFTSPMMMVFSYFSGIVTDSVVDGTVTGSVGTVGVVFGVVSIFFK